MADWKRPEVLAPAGDFERLTAAVRYGADAIYLGGKDFGMRASPVNFTEEAGKIIPTVEVKVKNEQQL